ncbi:MAG: S41 family peptidase [bacterium]|nr:S41 family peptidase [bacterium]
MTDTVISTISSKRSLKITKPVLGLIIFLGLLVVFALGFSIGRVQGAREVVPAGEGIVEGIGEVPSYISDNVDFRLFWETWNHLKDSYYRQPVSDKDLFYGALKGLVAGVEDPYSVFFDPEETQIFTQELEGSFGGVGMEIGIREDQLQVIAPLPGTPAEAAGLRTGDKIFAIDGEDTVGMSVGEAVFLIRGEKGTTVVLTISHNGFATVEDVAVVRDKIQIDSVKMEIEDGVAVISIATFNEDAISLFGEAVQEVLTKDVKGIILDLRNDPGGLLEAAMEISSEWANGRPVVIQRVKGVEHAYKGSGVPRLSGIPTVVLVNGGSASASEIVAGALQDYDLATIVGEVTFGKGSVQDYQLLSDKSSVKITIAEWLTPNGNSIHENGIQPDILVPYTIEDFEAERDPQMDMARSVLNGTYEPSEETIEAVAE